jgi:uncharacterized protein
MDMLSSDDRFKEFCASFLKNADTGISRLTVEEQRIEATKVPKPFFEQLQGLNGQDLAVNVGGPGLSYELDAETPNTIIRKSLAAHHRIDDGSYAIAFQDESDGTQRCLNLLPAIYHMTQEPRVYVIDEIDRSLHPLLCHSLIDLFLRSCPRKYQQMIVTTHETHLLDLDLLRRDEIWFVDKDPQQKSRLRSLAEWSVRTDLRIRKGYLLGRFGGIPFIGDTRKLMDLIAKPQGGATREKKTAP